MEAMGLLAGGVAHDFNNVLTIIQGNAELMMRMPLAPEEYAEYAGQIAAASERAANLTRQLLMFSRKQVIQPVNLDLNHTVTQMTRMLQRILGEDISLISQYAPNLPAMKGDAGMIEQIILNLAVNARDAMPNGGQLTIATSANGFNDNNSCVCLSVTDNGCGIPQETIPHIFEPFFTTKEIGKGTGLGLATVFSIVQQHQGKIEVISDTGRGATFHVKFPITPGIGANAVKPDSVALPGGSETILVVEDEISVRMFVSRLLERCGYRIISAESGIDALAIWEKNKQQIDLLLTDIIMPGGLNGYDLAGRLLAEKPQLKVIYTSGYTGDPTGKRSTMVEGVNFLQKPYPPLRLAEILRAALNSK
jgi:CheY-like chemotaxis protein